MVRKRNYTVGLHRTEVRYDSSSDDYSSDESNSCLSSSGGEDIEETKGTMRSSSDENRVRVLAVLVKDTSAKTDSMMEEGDPYSMPQSAEAFLAEFTAFHDQIQAALIDFEYDAMVLTPCECKRRGNVRQFRCFDCARIEVVCEECLKERHRLLPFHWAEKWTGEYFERIDLSSLGLLIHLGHRGRRCESVAAPTTHLLTVADINGIHKCKVIYCGCAGKEHEVLQLVKYGLFPASAKFPHIAFTQNALRDFHVHTTVSKKSAYDYVEALRKKTNNFNPSSVPTAQFIRIAHYWRLLSAERRSGQLHGFNDETIQRPRGSFAIPCLACPLPGFNTNEVLSDEFKNSKFLSVDANFHLIGLNKRNNLREKAMWDGRGYVRKQEDLDAHINEFGDIREEKSSCSNFAAIQNANNTLKHRGQNASGLVVVLCRHGLCEPEGAVNLQKGERHINVDYALSGALKCTESIPRINLSYDINCQYSVNIVKRFQKCFPQQTDIVRDVVKYFIGTFHANGHKHSCQYGYSLPFTHGVGRTDGEEVERYWAEMNQVAGSTKQMGPGHRCDTLDDFNAASNWSKIQTMGVTLYERRKLAVNMEDEFKKSFNDLDTRIRRLYSDKCVRDWEIADTKPTKDQNGEWTSVYQLQLSSIPSLQNLPKAKHRATRSTSKSAMDVEDFIYEAISIQRRQLYVKSKSQENSSTVSLNTLMQDIKKWETRSPSFMPNVTQPAPDDPRGDVEEIQLRLPSSFTDDERRVLGLQEIAKVEYKLREGQAYDALSELREAIRGLQYLTKLKQKYGHGKQANTRTSHAKSHEADIKHKSMMEYQAARQYLLALGMHESNAKLRPLSEADTYRPAVSEPHELGSGTKALGWIWTVGGDELDIETLPGTLEENRVLWFRTRVLRDRWREERIIVEEECRRLVRGFDAWSALWGSASKDLCERNDFGSSAFAARKNAVYSAMANNVRLVLGDFKVDDKPAQGTSPQR